MLLLLAPLTHQVDLLPLTHLPHKFKSSIEISCEDLQNPAYQQAILNTINQIRQQSRQCGQQYFSAAKPLSWNNNLYQGANAHSKDMANNNFLGHVGSTGLDLRARLKNIIC